jgi:hypothetical protein
LIKKKKSSSLGYIAPKNPLKRYVEFSSFTSFLCLNRIAPNVEDERNKKTHGDFNLSELSIWKKITPDLQ